MHVLRSIRSLLRRWNEIARDAAEEQKFANIICAHDRTEPMCETCQAAQTGW